MILAIETPTEICSAALVHQGVPLCSKSLNEKNIHSEKLMMVIDEILHQTTISLKEVDAIAVSIGPGSFTGLRIGLSTAKGLACARDIPIIAVPTLDGIAESYRITAKIQSEKFCALIDAKRSEAFYAFYAISGKDILLISEYAIGLKDEILLSATSKNAEINQPEISAIGVGLLAERHKEKLTVKDFSYLEPLYLRDFVATTPKNKFLH